MNHSDVYDVNHDPEPTMNNHTQGPWQIDPQHKGAIFCAEIYDTAGGHYARCQLVASVAWGRKPGEGMDNATLIVTAPELFESLTELYDSVVNRQGGMYSDEQCRQILERARHVLRKVEG